MLPPRIGGLKEMKKERLLIVGLVIMLSTLILLTGFFGRIGYEQSVRYAFVATDMDELTDYQLNHAEQLQSFDDVGAHVVTVHPLTVKGLRNDGKLDLISYSSLAINQDDISRQIRDALGNYPMKGENLIALVTDPALQGFIAQELSYRYTDYTNAFLEDGTTMVFAFQNLTQQNDLIVGYDYAELNLIKQVGMNAAVVYPSYTFENAVYPKYLKEFVNGNNVSFLILEENPYDNQKPMPEEMKTALRNLDVSLVLMEQANQVGNQTPYLYEDMFSVLKYNTIRGFSIDKIIPHDSTLYRYRYHQWFNSAIERNTVFIRADILKNPEVGNEENVHLTLQAIADFTGNLRGYQIGGERPEIPYIYGEETMAMAGGILLLSLLYLYLLLIVKKTPPYITETYFGLMIVTVILSYAFATNFTGLFALGIMVTASSMVSALLFRLDQKFTGYKKLVWMLVSSFILITIGVISISALLGGIEFYVSAKLFRGVVLSLLSPLAMAVVNGYLIYYYDTVPIKEIPTAIWQRIQKMNRWILISVGAFGLLFVTYYLIRSGKSNLILPLEDNFRKWLSDTLYIRPRLKEFLFAYPAFALLLFVTYTNKKTVWKFFFGVCATLLFTSIFNTFCHTFTAVTVSLHRILNGFLCGLIVVGVVFGVVVTIRYLLKQAKEPKKAKEVNHSEEKTEPQAIVSSEDNNVSDEVVSQTEELSVLEEEKPQNNEQNKKPDIKNQKKEENNKNNPKKQKNQKQGNKGQGSKQPMKKSGKNQKKSKKK